MNSKQSGVGYAFFNKYGKILGIVIMMALCMTLVFNGASMVHAKDDVEDFSMYKRSSEIMGSFSEVLSPTKDKGVNGAAFLKDITAGNAGAFTGFAEDLQSGGIAGWIIGKLSNSSSTFSYDSLLKLPTGGGETSSELYHYAMYGRALTLIGVDETVKGGGIASFLGGYLLWGAYLLASAVPILFKFIIDLLIWVNPFRLFSHVPHVGDVFAGTGEGGQASNGQALPGILDPVAQQVSEIFIAFQQWGLYIIVPMTLLSAVIAVFLLRKANPANRFARVFIRLLIVVAALPIVGSTYTILLVKMSESLDDVSNGYADKVIASTLVDFEGWSSNTRLALPDGVDLTLLSGSDSILGLSANSTTDPRTLAFKINQISNVLPYGLTALDDSADPWQEIDTDREMNSDSSKKITKLIERYASNEAYDSSDYEGEVKAELTAHAASSDDANNKVFAWFSYTKKGFDNAQGKIDDTTSSSGETEGEEGEDADSVDAANSAEWEGKDKVPTMLFSTSNPISIYNNGGLTAATSTSSGTFIKFSGGGTSKVTSFERSDGGLSTVSMYNYLNTTFDESGMTVYSSEKSASEFSRRSHKSVTLAGRGGEAFFIWLEAFAALLCMALLGFVFAFFMMVTAFQSVFKVIGTAFGVATGSLAMFTKLLLSVIVILLTTISSITIYLMGMEILTGLMQGIRTVLSV